MNPSTDQALDSLPRGEAEAGARAKPTHKIIFINRFFHPDHSATSQILTDLALDLARDGWNVEVVTSRLMYDDSAKLPVSENVGGVRVHRIWTSQLGRGQLLGRAVDYFTFYVSAAFTLWRITTPDTVLVAKTDPPMISLVAAPVAKLRGATLVNWLQDLFPEVAVTLGMRVFAGPVFRFLRYLRNASLKAATTNVVLGQRMRDMVERQGVERDRIVLMPNWADGEEIRPVARGVNPLRAQWGLEDTFVVSYSGNLGRAHEFSTIVEAAEALRHRADIRFLFIGAGAQRAELESQVAERKLANVLFHPYQPRSALSQSLSVGDVHLVSLNPALEGLIVPSKFYGIAAAGRPTLFIGDVDGEIARVVTDAHCGYAVASGDGTRLAALIEQLAGDRALCETLAANARHVFEQRFERKLVLQQWKEALGRAAWKRA